MSAEWQADHQWARRFIPEMKSIVAQVLIGEASVDEDREHNTDLIVLRVDETRVACRVRRYDQYDRYAGEFTIRAARPSGQKTELEKLIEGWGRYLLYAFADPTETRLYAHVLGDLTVFRSWYTGYMRAHGGQEPGVLKANKDDSSSFRAFRIADLPPAFAVRRYAPAPVPATAPPKPMPQRNTPTHTELAYVCTLRRMGKVAVQQFLAPWLPAVKLHERGIGLLTEAQAHEALSRLEGRAAS